MSAPSRSAQFTKLHKVLKKHYKPVSVSAERPVLEHLIFACLLEDAPYEVAEETFAKMVEEYFDWNEIRVSSVRELTETLARLPDPPAAATRLKQVLQHVFEASYSFDLEGLRKKNLGPAAETIKKIKGATPFGVAYVVQSALGGHSIPLDAGTLEVMRILDLATDKEVEERSIAGLERAIAKNKGIEFGSLLHQLGAEFTANPFAAELRNKLLEVDPQAKKRWPKRGAAKKPAEPSAETPGRKTESQPAAGAGKPDAAKHFKPASSKKVEAKKATKKKTSPADRKKTSSASKPSVASKGKKKKVSGLAKRKPR
ncbi:MAG: hypothetical protein JW719_07085 [Pirellulales bacterium]|nr:hypothetical protein [Pirellulales bacterium]